MRNTLLLVIMMCLSPKQQVLRQILQRSNQQEPCMYATRGCSQHYPRCHQLNITS